MGAQALVALPELVAEHDGARAMKKAEPFMPFFVGDFIAATSEWEGEEASLYLTLLGYQWSLGSLPVEPHKLCRLVRWDRKAFDRCWPQVSVKFIQRGDRLVNNRLERHRDKVKELGEKNAASGKKGAEARWRKDGERSESANGESIASAMPSAIAQLRRTP